MKLTLEQRIEILEQKMSFVKYLMWEQYYKCGSGQLFGEPNCKGCRNHGACVFATDYGQENEDEASTKRVETEEEIDNLFVDFDEMGFSPTTLCGDAEKYAIEWRNDMRKAITKHETDTLHEFVEWLKQKQHVSVENYKKLFEQTKNYLYCGKQEEAEYTLETLDGDLEKFLEERRK